MKISTSQQAQALLAGKFGTEINKFVSSCVTPVFWSYQDKDGTVNIRNGTAFFVDTGSQKFGVTADHVMEGALSDQAQLQFEGPFLLPVSYDQPIKDPEFIDFQDALISRDKGLDIATFEVSQALLNKLGIVPISVWPPKAPARNGGILFAGFPGDQRRTVGPKTLEFSVFPGSAIANSVSDDRISLHLDRKYTVNNPDFPTPSENFDVGGMSGGPVLTIIENENFFHFGIGGVIVHGSSNWQLMYATRADFIESDGQISKRIK